MGRTSNRPINKINLLKVWKRRFDEGVISENYYKKFLNRMFGG